MSIDKLNISNRGIDRAQGTQAAEQVKNTEKSRQVSGGSDSVAFSSKAKEMDRLTSKVEDSRSARLEQVRQQIEWGTYKVATKDLAQKLIDTNTK